VETPCTSSPSRIYATARTRDDRVSLNVRARKPNVGKSLRNNVQIESSLLENIQCWNRSREDAVQMLNNKETVAIRVVYTYIATVVGEGYFTLFDLTKSNKNKTIVLSTRARAPAHNVNTTLLPRQS